MKIYQSIDGIVPVVCTWSLRMHLSPANMFIFITDLAIFWPCYSFTCQLNEQNNGETTSWVQQELWVITFTWFTCSTIFMLLFISLYVFICLLLSMLCFSTFINIIHAELYACTSFCKTRTYYWSLCGFTQIKFS